MKIAVYPGSFDPVTNGHLDVIRRASHIFDKVIVAVLTNQAKTPVFTKEERVEMIREVTQDLPNVEAEHFCGLLVDYCDQVGAQVIVKGLRAISDFEYEFQMALTNRQINPKVETVFLTTATHNMYISSSIVRDVASFGGCIDEFVPPQLVEKIKQKYQK
ncbi:MAG: pantetheine-phosphate adenylyltransferase [Eubacteriales bacterium]|jgi:pantetheine-phosphate adenylyltransferase